MSRIIAILACGFALAACSMSMPSLDYFRSAPATEVLRIESEPPGADARTASGEACRSPCELTVASGGDIAVTFALNGYQSITVPVHAEAAGRLQPNPVYAELQPAAPPARPGRKRPAVAKKKSGRERGASRSDPEPGSRAGTCGDDARRLSLAATATPAIAGLSPLIRLAPRYKPVMQSFTHWPLSVRVPT